MENNIVAIVNGQEITDRDVDNTILSFSKERQTYLNTEKGREELIKQMIDFELSYGYAKDMKFDETEDFKKQLEATKKQLLIQIAVSNVLARATVSEEESKKYYEENKEEFRTQELITARHILVDSEEEANNIYEEIKDGLDFSEAAEKYSKCPSKAQGGSLGTFTRGQMVPEFEKAVLEAEVDKVTEAIKTQFGYHLIIVDNIKESMIKPFDEVKAMIDNKLLQEKQNQQYNEFTQNLRDKYTVEIK
ncbi:PpiC-type peptidyl-prolyl cis-trans isomerase [Clostridium sporogenes]|uniref:peptidylprolyl isomerase n=1 Tax=Clostridium botulinum TaxID=1491 RepID=UPI0007179F66|nr:peptidylprolyl isomerase [Clostridium botulinum]KRU28481.1 PpiC-type peptidyl-prolyl cis-trans isomerase [Clostridium sporogenes]KRU31404.1 PpiC-type peptidyl-prolyl cis-trans isomerase [Clostridium sporogenes]KRU32947.1 PpiC-type peptidyl-prolyl cis-trans isomerase [Clostridium sporogenes]KRU44912.1 PpiC-type peptidyl-prolyl cis-trans isomerase [Clostridium sporogenes]MBZ1331203.1 peptidylprolyl isomerase [Clostridium botulinum]